MRTVVVVDDEPVDRFVTEQVIARVGKEWNVIAFPDAMKALNFLSFSMGHGGSLPELIVFDLFMPVTDGLEFVRTFNQLTLNRTDRSRLVMLTISENKQLHKQALLLGVNQVVMKPITPQKWSLLSL